MTTETEMKDHEFILNHVVLPRWLPQEKPPYLKQIKLMAKMVENVTDLSRILPSNTVNLMKRLRKIHSDGLTGNEFMAEISKQIKGLKRPGDTFAMFVRRQNCTFMVHVPTANADLNSDEPQNLILATFPGDMQNSDVYRFDSDLEVSFSEKYWMKNTFSCLKITHFFFI